MNTSTLRFVLSRLFESLLSLLLLSLLVFVLLRLAPGGPFDTERSLDVTQQAALAARHQFQDSWSAQYLGYVRRALQGDFGVSYQYLDFTVAELVGRGLLVSASLGGAALCLCLALAMPMGVLAGLRAGSTIDRLLQWAQIALLSLPKFVLAPLLVLVFAVALRWLPAAGFEFGDLRTWVLPVLALALPNIAVLARLLRHDVRVQCDAGHIRAAHARGIEGWALFRRHFLPGNLLTVLAWLPGACTTLLTGSMIVEQVFAIPGMGRYFVQGALNRDYNLVMAVALISGALLLLAQLLADLLRGWIDPRLRETPQ
jgi:oligopeptide transport system permease protein